MIEILGWLGVGLFTVCSIGFLIEEHRWNRGGDL